MPPVNPANPLETYRDDIIFASRAFCDSWTTDVPVDESDAFRGIPLNLGDGTPEARAKAEAEYFHVVTACRAIGHIGHLRTEAEDKGAFRGLPTRMGLGFAMVVNIGYVPFKEYKPGGLIDIARGANRKYA